MKLIVEYIIGSRQRPVSKLMLGHYTILPLIFFRFTNEKLWYKDIGSGKGPKKKILPEKYRRLFANKQIVCIEYQDITDDDEREIFQVNIFTTE